MSKYLISMLLLAISSANSFATDQNEDLCAQTLDSSGRTSTSTQTLSRDERAKIYSQCFEGAFAGIANKNDKNTFRDVVWHFDPLLTPDPIRVESIRMWMTYQIVWRVCYEPRDFVRLLKLISTCRSDTLQAMTRCLSTPGLLTPPLIRCLPYARFWEKYIGPLYRVDD